MPRVFHILTAVTVTASSALFAATAPNDSGTDNEIISILDDATTTVTRSRLNVDYTPSVVTVLEHQQLKSLGINTLFEALSILPGVETSINQTGFKKVVIRGFDNPNTMAYDKASLIIDGVTIETGLFGNKTYYLSLPTDIIERIEVLRGPGSALYGSGAFNGVINVITRQNSHAADRVFFSAGSYDYRLGGMQQHYRIDGHTAMDVDFYYQQNKKMLPMDESFRVTDIVDPDTGNPIAFERALTSNEALDDYSIAMTFSHRSWTVKSRLKHETNGLYYGWLEYPELTTANRIGHRYFFAQIEHSTPLTPHTVLNEEFGFSHYKAELDTQSYTRTEAFPGTLSPYTFNLYEKEYGINLGLSVATSAVEAHNIIAGAEFKTVREIDNSINDDITAYGERPLIKRDLRRNILALYARDTVTLNENLSALFALRYECYGSKHKFYPGAQAGLLYSANGQWNFKLNYGHAFRSPSWLEQYAVEYGPGDSTRAGNPDITPEETDTFEAVAIYRSGETHHWQLNLYYSLLQNVIDIDESPDYSGYYTNRADRTSYGAEMAYTLKTYKQDQLHINFTYNHTSYETLIKEIKQSMPGVARVMVKGYYTHYLTPNISLSTLVKHIGTRELHKDFVLEEQKKELGSYTTTDLTLNVMDWHNWNYHASVKNLFDINDLLLSLQ